MIMGALRLIRLPLSILVYFAAITLGTGLLVIDPLRVLLIVPLLTCAVLLGHAVKTGHLDELGYATMGLWAAVLVLIVGGLTIEAVIFHRDMPPVVEIQVARVLGTVGLITILGSIYIRGVQRARRDEGRGTLPA
jgi:hypothetical protein